MPIRDRQVEMFANGVRIGHDRYTVAEEYRYAGERRYRPRARSRYWASCRCGWTAHGTTLPPVRQAANAHECVADAKNLAAPDTPLMTFGDHERGCTQ
jgi:hypothetical protein